MAPIAAALVLALFAGANAAGLPDLAGHRQLIEAEDIDYSKPSRASFRAQFESEDFKLNLEELPPPATPGMGGSAKTVSVDTLPTLAGEGVGMVRLTLEPCGINMPHVHPRATELLLMIDGEPDSVLATFAEENGGRVIENTLSPGQATFFPKGLVHYQYNMGCKPALLVAALGHEDFGTQTITSQAIKNLPAEGLAASLGITEEALEILRAGFPANPSSGSEECRKRCGLE